MGSSLHTPASIPQDSFILQDGSCPADKSLSTEEGGSSNEVKEANMMSSTRKPRIPYHLKGKEKELAAAVGRRGPLQLLDLPVDILKEIIKEVTHTNDLTSLALAHSALHNLTIPHIYSRFDIVWPSDSHTTADPRTGVDALTYGLATLVMGDDNSGELPLQSSKPSSSPLQTFTCKECGAANQVEHSRPPIQRRKRRRANHYAQYTRKFSLGNGPSDWVQEYLITKEGGKMLGTLVALAVARMPNLETFTWDMPTGILRDVWLALSSLDERHDGKDCRLERVWIRWHDNGDESILTGGPQVSESVPPPHLPPPTNSTMPAEAAPAHTGTDSEPSGAEAYHHSPLAQSQNRVERPTFSVLPPLRSLSVLDIDELAYLDEMSILIGRSQHILRELRVGIALHAEKRAWAISQSGEDNQQGGVLGILMRNIFDMGMKTRPEGFKFDKNLTSQSASPTVPDGTDQSNGVFSDPAQVSSGPCTGPSEDIIRLASNGNEVDQFNVAKIPGLPRLTSNAKDVATMSSNPSESSGLLEYADHTVPIGAHVATSDKGSTVDSTPGVSHSSGTEGFSEVLEHSSPNTFINTHVLALTSRTHLPTTPCGLSSQQAPLLAKLKLEVLELERVPL
ncbi:MAG: hypothetical protein M1830_002936, partial [Pleopsidium flavum]